MKLIFSLLALVLLTSCGTLQICKKDKNGNYTQACYDAERMHFAEWRSNRSL